MLYNLYKNYTKHFPKYLFGYAQTDLWISLSVMEKRSGKAMMDKIALDSTEEQLKIAWYRLLKQLMVQ